MQTARVMDHDTGSALEGTPSAELVRESAAEVQANATGAVPAYRDDSGVWQYMTPQQRDDRAWRALAGIRDVRTVYVAE